MEYGIVTAIDGIATVHVCTYQVSIFLVLFEAIGLVRGSVRAENVGLIDVVGVCARTPYVIDREPEGIEVLVYGNDGREVIVARVHSWRKGRFDD